MNWFCSNQKLGITYTDLLFHSAIDNCCFLRTQRSHDRIDWDPIDWYKPESFRWWICIFCHFQPPWNSFYRISSKYLRSLLPSFVGQLSHNRQNSLKFKVSFMITLRKCCTILWIKLQWIFNTVDISAWTTVFFPVVFESDTLLYTRVIFKF